MTPAAAGDLPPDRCCGDPTVTGVVVTAARLVLFPVAAAATGAGLAAWRAPGKKVTSGGQHFAAGVVFAALAGEVLPDLRGEGHLGAVLVGFTVGVGLLLALAAYRRRQEAATVGETGDAGAARPAGTVALPWGMLVAVGIDLVIDGLLVGLGATLGSKHGLVLTAALTIEILFLAVSVAQLLEQGQPRARATLVAGSLGLLTAVGALAGAALLGGASRTTLAAVPAFGAAALLYLVVEELLVEAHKTDETPLLAAMFFAGFIGLYALAGRARHAAPRCLTTGGLP